MQYRRADVAGGCYFFTVNLVKRNTTLLIDEIDQLRNSFNKVKKAHPFILDAMVIMPDHLHVLMTLPKGDSNFSNRWTLIKSAFSRQLPKIETLNKSRLLRGERGIWQRRYWEHLIRDEDDYQKHVDYIHYNPVKHHYVKSPIDWPYSTIHHHIVRGYLNSDWGCDENSFYNLSFGENNQ